MNEQHKRRLPRPMRDPRKYNLPFDHIVIAELRFAPDWYYVTVFQLTSRKYVTYQANANGDCAHGHYDIAERTDAIDDMINRSKGGL